MAEVTVSPKSGGALTNGSFRLQVRMPRGWVRVGTFPSLLRVGIFAQDLLENMVPVPIEAVRVEFRDRRGWHTAWSWSRPC